VIHNLFQFGFAGLAGICLVAALLRRTHRGSFVAAALSAGSAAVAAHFDIFWAVAVFGLGAVWALFTATSFVDLWWRVKTGFVFFLGLGAVLSVYPTYMDERFGREEHADLSSDERSELETKARRGDLGLSEMIRSNIPFRLVRGLDLKGGLRLVYTVDVEEAIKDKRDHHYDDLRAAVATALGFHSGDKPPTVEELSKLAGKVVFFRSKEQSQAGTIVVTFNDAADAQKLNDDLLKPFLKDLALQRSADGKKLTFHIRSDVESTIRADAVNKAKETVRRRIDGLGVKEASLTVRDEDLIIEVPGEDERQFAELRDIIAQTARLEFKMVDDDTDFFDQVSKSEVLPKGVTFPVENAPVGKSAGGEKRSKANHYARITRGEHEDMRDALLRLKEWTSSLTVDADHEIGFGKLMEYNEEKDAFEDVGWRTYYLFSKAEITGDMVREASAQPDDSGKGLGGWHVRMEMTPKGGDIFEEITGRNINRRFAIILDGKVESAPVIITKIPGGIATITMGSGNPEQQLADSRKLELVLKSGALPAPIEICARPPPILVRMTGAESTTSSRMMAKRRLTFAPVTSSNRSAPAGENDSET
jgi:preprotein translocase subunit SecD